MIFVRLALIAICFVAGLWSTLASDQKKNTIKQIFWHQHLRVPAGQRVLGVIDNPADVAELKVQRDSVLGLSGWTVATNRGSRVQRLAILVDGVEVAQVVDFFSRPDVSDAYNRPDFENSGWRAMVPLSGLQPGKHVLQARAIASDGGSGDLPSIVLHVQ